MSRIPRRVSLSLLAALSGAALVYMAIPLGLLPRPMANIDVFSAITGLLGLAVCVVGWVLIFYRRPAWLKSQHAAEAEKAPE